MTSLDADGVQLDTEPSARCCGEAPRPDHAPRGARACSASTRRARRGADRDRAGAAGRGGRARRRGARSAPASPGRWRWARSASRPGRAARRARSRRSAARSTTGSRCSRRWSARSTRRRSRARSRSSRSARRVEVGDTVCIVEAMKLMNEVAAGEAGKVVEIVVAERRAGRVRAGADVPRAARGLARVREGPDRQPRRDRAAGRPRLPRARHRDGRGLLDRRRRLRRRRASPTRRSSIGPPAAARSYLHIPSVIGAALKTGADAIHPGYGFLSEDPYFAEICADNDITFIGPRARGDGEGRRQGDRAPADARRRPAAAAGHDRAGRHRRRTRSGSPARSATR